jgi:hypothetical protein
MGLGNARPTPTALTVTLTDSSTVTVTLPTSFAAIPGQSNVDTTIGSIMKRGGFWNDAQTTWYPVGQIKTITYS